MTTVMSINDFRSQTDEVLDTVIETQEAVIVVLADGRKFVLVPGNEYEALHETSYLVSTFANHAALVRGMCEVNEGKTVEIDL